jgi:anthranilate synthase component 1
VPVLSLLCNTADLLSLHQANPQRYPVLLETASGDGWDILLAFPQQTLLFKTGQAKQYLSQLDTVSDRSRLSTLAVSRWLVSLSGL